MIYFLIVECIPIVLMVLFALVVWDKKQPVSVPFSLSMAVCVVIIFAVAALPNDVSNDKPRYVAWFHELYYWGVLDVYKDPGWMYYVAFCAMIFRNNEFLFFLLTAAVYIFSYLAFAKRFFEDKSFYFILMAMGCTGFFSYAANAIRPGFAIAFLLLGLSSPKKSWAIVLMFCSVLLHRSMGIPIVAYLITRIVDKRWMYYSVWLVCLLLAASNLDMGTLFETLGFLDERVEVYAESIGQTVTGYKQGFRLDFLIYSVLPMAISSFFVTKHKIEDETFSRIFNMYVLTNSVWLLAIRVVFADRIAYLSWFLIPFLMLYPIIKYPDKYKNPNLLTLGVMFFFMGINIVLMII